MISDYRIFAEDSSHGVVYSVHEVFYDEDKNPTDYVHIPLSLISTDLEDLVEEIQLTLEAFELPILSIKDFPNPF
jgi:hypothetical protein